MRTAGPTILRRWRIFWAMRSRSTSTHVSGMMPSVLVDGISENVDEAVATRSPRAVQTDDLVYHSLTSYDRTPAAGLHHSTEDGIVNGLRLTGCKPIAPPECGLRRTP